MASKSKTSLTVERLQTSIYNLILSEIEPLIETGRTLDLGGGDGEAAKDIIINNHKARTIIPSIPLI